MSIHTHSRAAWAVASLTAIAAVSTLIYAQTTPPAGAAAPGLGSMPATPPPLDLSTVKPEDAKAYLTTYGWLIGQRAGVKQLGLTADEIDTIAAGMKLAITSGAGPNDIPGGEAVGDKMKDYLEARAEKIEQEQVVKQRAASDKFFADLDKDPNVKKTATGLYYTIINPGTDPKPTATDIVSVKYKGTLIDGTVFDQTDDKDPQNAIRDFPLGEVIPGWTEGLKLIGKGGVIKLYIPAKLGYGDQSNGPIPAGSTLIFETTITDIKPAPAPDLNAMQLSPDVIKSLGGNPAPAPSK